MSRNNLIKPRFDFAKKADLIASIVCIIVGVLIIVVSEYYHLHRSNIGFAILIPSAFYLCFRKKLTIPQTQRYLNGVQQKRVTLLLTIAFIICFLYSIFLLEAELYHRSFTYFVAITAACAIITSQILVINTKKYIWLILLEIFLISINIRAGVYFEFQSVYGFDPNYHLNLIKELVALSHIPSGFSYSSFPVMHITVAVTKILSGVSFKTSFFVVSIIEVICTIFAFLIGRSVFNSQIGLLATLMLNISNYHIVWGYWIIPMGLGAAFFTIIIYLLIRKSASKHEVLILFAPLVLLFLILVIFTHTISTFVMFITLISIFLAIKSYNLLFAKANSIVSIGVLSFFAVSFISYWMYTSPASHISFFSSMVRSTQKALSMDLHIGEVSRVTTASELPQSSLILNEMGYSILIGLMVIGILASLPSKYRNGYRFSLIVLIVVLFSIIYIPSLAGINLILPARWFVFAYLVACCVAAFGVSILTRLTRSPIMKNIVAVIVVCILTFFMITTPIGSNTDSPIYSKETTQRCGFFESEVKATDFLMATYNNYQISINSKYAIILNSSNPITFIDPRVPRTYDSGVIIIRNADIQQGFYIPFPKEKINENVKPGNDFIDSLENVKSCIYKNGEVKMYMS